MKSASLSQPTCACFWKSPSSVIHPCQGWNGFASIDSDTVLLRAGKKVAYSVDVPATPVDDSWKVFLFKCQKYHRQLLAFTVIINNL